MKRLSSGLERPPAGAEIDDVVTVTPIRRAATRVYKPAVPQLAKVVGDQVLRLVDELGQLPHSPVTSNQLPQQLPPQGMSGQPDELRGISRNRKLHDLKLTTRPKINQTRLMDFWSEVLSKTILRFEPATPLLFQTASSLQTPRLGSIRHPSPR